MANKDALLAYKNAEVAKVFPLYGTEPFKGTVKEVDTSGKDNRRFHIVYEDGDNEWITLQELQSILVKDVSRQEAAKSDKKRARSSKQTSSDAAAAPQSDAAAAAAADQQQAHNKPKKQKQAKTSSQQQQQQQQQQKQQAEQQQQGLPGPTSFTITAGAARAAADKPAAAAGSSKDAAAAAAGRGEQTGTPSKRAAAAAAAGVGPTGTPSRKGAAASGRGAAAGGGASMSTADTQGMLANIHQNAAPIADKLSHDREIARMPYQGPGAAGLPAMSQVVIAGGLCYISLHSAPRPRHSTTPGKALNIAPSSSTGQPGSSNIDYEAESVALLGELARLLQHANIDKRWLVKVRVTLRSMQEGLPAFQAAWKAWAKRDELPVLTLVEGAGPFNTTGVMLEATALAAP